MQFILFKCRYIVVDRNKKGGDYMRRRILIDEKTGLTGTVFGIEDTFRNIQNINSKNSEKVDGRKLILLSSSILSATGWKLIKYALKCMNSGIDRTKRIILIYDRVSDVGSIYSASGYETAFIDACKRLGFEQENVLLSDDIHDDYSLRDVIEDIDYIYIPDGNIYRTMRYIRFRGLGTSIRKAVKTDKRAVYIGSSAGAVTAGTDIELIDYGEFDRNEVMLSSDAFEALGLFDGTVIPHYDEDEYLQSYKKSMIKDGKLELMNRYNVLFRLGNDEIMVAA